MELNNLSAKKICRLISAGMVFTMLVITGIIGGIMPDRTLLLAGVTLPIFAFFCIWLFVLYFQQRVSHLSFFFLRTLAYTRYV
ncbi:hypothetical protein BGU37_17860 [Clostridioides difficile]|nr:hypothetical protein BGU37_17860 [Clostridioides difficile]